MSSYQNLEEYAKEFSAQIERSRLLITDKIVNKELDQVTTHFSDSLNYLNLKLKLDEKK
tara:strand:+ start:163 stop:339 length:177 start_codon:yes stop_codon:yes gene_type:complete